MALSDRPASADRQLREVPPMSNGTMRPPRPAAKPADEPLKHVIAEYKHQAQTITCVCGWHGKSSSLDGRTSEWTTHLAAFRTKPR
jgi:hypothetical protein